MSYRPLPADHNPLQCLRHPYGDPGWQHPTEHGAGIIQIADWLPEGDADWLARHLELAGYRYSPRWWSGIWF